jgi:hypothetical protein
VSAGALADGRWPDLCEVANPAGTVAFYLHLRLGSAPDSYCETLRFGRNLTPVALFLCALGHHRRPLATCNNLSERTIRQGKITASMINR